MEDSEKRTEGSELGQNQFQQPAEPRRAPQPAERTAPAINTFIGGLLVGVCILGSVYLAMKWFYRPGEPGVPDNFFGENFDPPESFLNDFGSREKPGDDQIAPSENCGVFIQMADRFYQESAYEEAMEPLLTVALDSVSGCQSDAWFYLGILNMKLDDPGTAIQCFSKIEDFARFGDDIQWFMALCLARVAETDAGSAPQAKRALERVLNSAQSEKRRAQAQKMLDAL